MIKASSHLGFLYLYLSPPCYCLLQPHGIHMHEDTLARCYILTFLIVLTASCEYTVDAKCTSLSIKGPSQNTILCTQPGFIKGLN